MQKRILTLVLALLALTGLAAGYETTLTRVTLLVDGQARPLRTHQPTVGLLLTDLGVTLRPEDNCFPTLDTPLERGMTIRIERAHPMVLAVDGQERIMYTHTEDPTALLAEAGVMLGPHDQYKVRAPLSTDPPETRSRIVVERAVALVLEEGGLRTPFYTHAATVGEALFAAGVHLYRADRLFPDPATPVQEGMHIRLERSIPVTVQLDKHTLRTRTHRNRVGEVLADLGVTLNGEDYTLPPLDTALGEGLDIQVVRVTERILVEQSPVPFETEWRPESTMELDTQGLVQEGAPGVLERRIRVRYEDGEVVERRTEGQSIVLAPTNRIMGYGTNIVVRQAQTPSGPVEYWRVIRMLATSYSAGTAGTPKSSPYYGRTALGLPMQYGIVAVDRNVVPLGSKVYVPGYGVGLAGDTGGAIRGRRIDLGYDDNNLKLWYSWVDVYLLTPVPSADKINYILGP